MAKENESDVDVVINTSGAYGSQREHDEMLQRSGAIFGGKGMIRHATGRADGDAPDLDWKKARP